ncbi:C-type lectin domain family 4 member E-like [Poecilia formosa]|uniref:C-type lectin domain family 4 member E-like n=1 Tax=Poecilia formosa TaxID=48698 RepID=UPI0007B7E230|nr:PREDICTED: C-type lectin domain family 4 member E-like [Poecilia formosa]
MLKHFNTLFCPNFVIDLIGKVNKPKCPPGWQRFMSSCYQLSTEANTWMYAKQNCESKGAQLMMLNDETEQRPFIGGVLKIWIGLYGQIQNNTFIWYLMGIDGRLLKSGGPNNPKPQFWTSFPQSCVYIDQSLPCMKTWSMGSCMEKFYWICETPMVVDLLEM